MILSRHQLDEAVRVLREMGARRILLFGSAPVAPEQARDIDVAVEGIPLSRLLEADVRLHDVLRVPTDLVSREESPAFFELVSRSAKVLYEQD